MLKVLTDERGQGLAEYGLILALVSIAAVIALGALGLQIATALQKVSDNLKTANGG